MKIMITCCLGLFLLVGSMATAQPAVLSSSPLCPGPPIKVAVDWTEFGFAPCRTGFNPFEFILSPITVANLRMHWRYTTGYFFDPHRRWSTAWCTSDPTTATFMP